MRSRVKITTNRPSNLLNLTLVVRFDCDSRKFPGPEVNLKYFDCVIKMLLNTAKLTGLLESLGSKSSRRVGECSLERLKFGIMHLARDKRVPLRRRGPLVDLLCMVE